ncbi:beta-1,3-galactosyltransferase 5-like [Protopterus annectens]|uniref:beta-1,3-galactosyltransferase 5-like n=1 Tax=Protopterus annectens TaxID=7888 RepID=UPI001CFC33BA|nr:beta-1,3-galactosyltransferase 5-like [Protopterus annectens]XP_043934949.1 beta-1,3-galactosyltransferase 5-like [Protopterus annectens]XP_043934952.1 beta-1,3-galactosyltransferase 5-like [Protopterus annectens]XP_043934958.1 beta-1,3-galactosyltransferase 5-like [Protopterus annectens]
MLPCFCLLYALSAMAFTFIHCLKVLAFASFFISLFLIFSLFSRTENFHEFWYLSTQFTRVNSKHFLKNPRNRPQEWGSGVVGGINFPSLFQGDYSSPVCKKGHALLILVTSAPWNSKQRNAIRNTWAKKMGPQKYSWQVIFMIGQKSDGIVSSDVLEEKEMYRDILVGNYVDTYRNLTLKVMHGLKWSLVHCRPHYILKTDDDCFVNTDRLPQFLMEHNLIKERLYIGSLFTKEKRHVIREPLSKWYVSKDDYSKEFYPPYASGIGYVLSLDSALVILVAAERVHPIPVEDAYVGILAKEGGITVKSSGRFTKHNVNWRVCNYRYLMVIHHVSAEEQETACEKMLRARTDCLNNEEIIKWK